MQAVFFLEGAPPVGRGRGGRGCLHQNEILNQRRGRRGQVASLAKGLPSTLLALGPRRERRRWQGFLPGLLSHVV